MNEAAAEEHGETCKPKHEKNDDDRPEHVGHWQTSFRYFRYQIPIPQNRLLKHSLDTRALGKTNMS